MNQSSHQSKANRHHGTSIEMWIRPTQGGGRGWALSLPCAWEGLQAPPLPVCWVSVQRRGRVVHHTSLIWHPRAEALGFSGQMLLDSCPGMRQVPQDERRPCGCILRSSSYTQQRYALEFGGLLCTRSVRVRWYWNVWSTFQWAHAQV